MSAAEFLKRMTAASIEAARSKLHEASSETELRVTATKALSILVNCCKPPDEPTEEDLQNIITAIGAYTLLEAFIAYFPNTEKILHNMDLGDQVFQKMIGTLHATSQTPRPSDSEED